jgi:predicted GIY-YIG superfamily endonuclease
MFANRKTIKNKQTNTNEDDLFLSSHIGGWVYILKSKKDNNLYIGSTNNLRKRFKEHNDGKVFSTKSRIPFELVYYEVYPHTKNFGVGTGKSEKDARLRESRLKQRRKAFAQLKKRIIFSII